eukprot:388458-Pelagomonas_calceolata.AAC.1
MRAHIKSASHRHMHKCSKHRQGQTPCRDRSKQVWSTRLTVVRGQGVLRLILHGHASPKHGLCNEQPLYVPFMVLFAAAAAAAAAAAVIVCTEARLVTEERLMSRLPFHEAKLLPQRRWQSTRPCMLRCSLDLSQK